jgi:hypothetical protein
MSDTPEPVMVIVDRVLWDHGETFVDEWREQTFATGAPGEAFARTGVVTWPDDPDEQMRFHDIQGEVTMRVFDAIRYAAAEAFVRIAEEVLARERGKEWRR